MRFLVERKPDVFDDVGADMCAINHGALVFSNLIPGGDELVVAYAPGEWMTVCPEDEA